MPQHRLPRGAFKWVDPFMLSFKNRNRRQIWLGSAGIGSWGGDLMGLEPNSNGSLKAIDLRDMPLSHRRLPSILFFAFFVFCGWPMA
jgi:hypothetical protein